MLFSNRVDGLLISLSKETLDFDHIRFFQDNNIPVVSFDRGTDLLSCDQIIIDDYTAANTIVNYMIERGHKNIIHLAAPQNLNIGYQRKKGFEDALKNKGLPYDEGRVILADKFDIATEKVIEVIKSGHIPDGIFAVNDLTALGALRALKKYNINVPVDVGVAGFGNGQNAILTEPPLTTINQNGYNMGRKAAEVVLNRINEGFNHLPPQKHYIETELVVRESIR
jgi:DNA-binding LacI/PurR family transcriptional regulator